MKLLIKLLSLTVVLTSFCVKAQSLRNSEVPERLLNQLGETNQSGMIEGERVNLDRIFTQEMQLPDFQLLGVLEREELIHIFYKTKIDISSTKERLNQALIDQGFSAIPNPGIIEQATGYVTFDRQYLPLEYCNYQSGVLMARFLNFDENQYVSLSLRNGMNSQFTQCDERISNQRDSMEFVMKVEQQGLRQFLPRLVLSADSIVQHAEGRINGSIAWWSSENSVSTEIQIQSNYSLHENFDHFYSQIISQGWISELRKFSIDNIEQEFILTVDLWERVDVAAKLTVIEESDLIYRIRFDLVKLDASGNRLYIQ